MLRRFRTDEGGFALIMALGALTVLSFVIISAITYTSSNSREASASKANQAAYVLAEAGINNAVAVLNVTTTPLAANLLPGTTTTYDGGTVTWSGTLDTSNPNVSCPGHTACWKITATGTTRNPAGGSRPETRTLRAKVPLDPLYSQPLVNDVYDYVFVYGTGATCDFDATNSSSFQSRLYVQGNLCLSNSAVVTDELHVWGTVTSLSPQSGIGTSSSFDTKGVHVKNGCRFGSGAFHTPCTSADHVWANPVDDAAPRTLTAPTIDWPGWYKLASPGPYAPCTTSSGTPPIGTSWATAFDNDQGSTPDPSKMNRSLSGTANLTPSNAYSCKTAYGELSWDPNAQVGGVTLPTLTVRGTVFIDANARIDPGGGHPVVREVGVGSLYLSGSLVIKNTNVCSAWSGSSCDWSLPGTGHWDVTNNFLNIVAGGYAGGGQTETAASNVSVEFVNVGYQGAVTAADRVDVGATTSFQGPLVEKSLTLGQSLTTYPFGTLSSVPSGTPGNQTKSVAIGTPTDYSE